MGYFFPVKTDKTSNFECCRHFSVPYFLSYNINTLDRRVLLLYSDISILEIRNESVVGLQRRFAITRNTPNDSKIM